jgi:hypothetical protein
MKKLKKEFRGMTTYYRNGYAFGWQSLIPKRVLRMIAKKIKQNKTNNSSAFGSKSVDLISIEI